MSASPAITDTLTTWELPILQPADAPNAALGVQPGFEQNVSSEPTCRLVTMGCKVNQYETQLVREALHRHGYRDAVDGESADVCVVNTCTVTGEADSKARQLIRQLAKANPGTRTVVFGCYATREPAALEQLPGVYAVVPDNRELPDVLQRFGVVSWPDGISGFDGHRRAFVKVQDGCILNCTYCIIPSVRPGLRSRQPIDILNEVRRLVANGYKEIVLTGIHLGHFGVETSRAKNGMPRYRLGQLLQDLDEIPGDWRLRLSSLEAAELDGEFLEIAARCKRLCPHFHLCLQSGSDTVLTRMKRRYRVRGFLENVERIRAAFHLPALSTDVIVGFPGETNAEWSETLQTISAAGFVKVHTFPFSARKGTPAADFADQVSATVKAARCKELAALENDLAGRYHRELVGQTVSMMVEARAAAMPGFVRGTSCRYSSVDVPGTPADRGQLLDVTITGFHDGILAGTRKDRQHVDAR